MSAKNARTSQKARIIHFRYLLNEAYLGRYWLELTVEYCLVQRRVSRQLPTLSTIRTRVVEHTPSLLELCPLFFHPHRSTPPQRLACLSNFSVPSPSHLRPRRKTLSAAAAACPRLQPEQRPHPHFTSSNRPLLPLKRLLAQQGFRVTFEDGNGAFIHPYVLCHAPTYTTNGPPFWPAG